MYLRASQYVSGYDHQTEESKTLYNVLLALTGAADFADADSPGATVQITVGYWRKVNAVHQWFVTNVQDGRDECQEAYVTRQALADLRVECCAVINMVEAGENVQRVAAAHLPTASGFFFGSTEYDEWYVNDLRETVKIIDRVFASVPSDWSITYQSSW